MGAGAPITLMGAGAPIYERSGSREAVVLRDGDRGEGEGGECLKGGDRVTPSQGRWC